MKTSSRDLHAEGSGAAPSRLARRLGLLDAVVIGLGAMIGAGVFAAIGPAAAAAGSGLLIGLGIAAVVAYCNASSSAQLAALYPQSGGTYVYGRERLGDFWGYLAGWGFVVGKTASGAAMALTFGAYAWPEWQRPLAVAAVVALTAVNYQGVQKTAWLTRIIVAVVLTALTAVVVGALAGGQASADNLGDLTEIGGWSGILQSAGLLFFAFAGYARLATLGEEVVDRPRPSLERSRLRSASRSSCTPRLRSRHCWLADRSRLPTPQHHSTRSCAAVRSTRLLRSYVLGARPQRSECCCR